ncbi:MAG: Na+/H+ antiporter subunit C [Rhodoferax sp.]
MEILISIAIGVLVACGIYLMLQAHSFSVVLGLTLLSYGVNLFLLSSGGLVVGRPAILSGPHAQTADPLPQALILTAIVIGFAMTAYLVVLCLRARQDLGSDLIDAKPCRKQGTALSDDAEPEPGHERTFSG